MRAAWCLGSIAVTMVALGGVWACGSSSSGGGNNGDGGGGGGGAQAYTFQPQGCGYTVFVPDTRAFMNFAKDDASGAGDTPLRVRIGLGGDVKVGQPGYADPSTTAAFTWETAMATNAAKVKLGTDANSLSDVHTGFSWTTPPPTVGIGANEPSSYLHEVHVCGLNPGTTYYYQVGGGPAGMETWSATQTFTTVPTTGAVKIGLLGDARDSLDTWQLAQQRMRDAAVNIQLIGGDIVDIGTLESLYASTLDRAWKDPHDATKFLTLGQQMMVAIAGNHENEAARFFANFSIPTGTNNPYAETFASFNVGGAHVVMLDDEAIAVDTGGDPQAAAQKQWIDDDLAAADGDRANHPFIVVVSHRGMFSTSLHGTDSDVLQVRAALAPIFDKHHVDLVVNGHDHEFEASKPLTANTMDPSGAPTVQPAGKGTVYVITAGAGADPYEVGVSMADYRDKSTKFGNGTPYAGVYSVASVQDKTMTVVTYGLKVSGGGVAGDDVLDTITLSH